MKTILCVDIGRRFLGFAKGFEGMTVALPGDTIQIADLQVKEAYTRIMAMIQKTSAKKLIIGYPQHSSDMQFLPFLDELIQLIRANEVPVILLDEYVSTMEATNRLADMDIDTTKVRKDALAAMIILERYLEGKGKIIDK